MTRRMKKTAERWVRGLFILAMVSVVPGRGLAAELPWLEMTIVRVVPTGVTEFLAAQTELSALEQEAGLPWRSVSRTAIFGDTYRFVIMRPLANLGAFDDDPNADPVRAAIIGRIRGVIASRETYALRATPTLNHALPDDQEPGLMIMQVVSVATGRESEYLTVMAHAVLPHFVDAEMHHFSGALTFGGEGGYVHVFHVEDFAELDRGSPFVRALGAPGAQEVLAKLAGVVTRSEQWLIRYVPDASFRPAPETAQ